MSSYHNAEYVSNEVRYTIQSEYNKSLCEGKNEDVAIFAGEGIDMIHDIHW